MICNWFLEGNLKNKLVSFRNNTTAILLSSVLVLHIIGLLYTSDFNYAFKDIRIKLPLLVLPLVISTSKPLSQKITDSILKVFVAAVICGSFISIFILTGLVHRPVIDTRSISIFISHIRFSLLICVAICVSLNYIFRPPNAVARVFWCAIAVWLFSFLIIMESLTGLTALLIVALILTLYTITRSKKKIIKYGGLVFILSLVAGIAWYIKSIASENDKKEVLRDIKLEMYTSRGNEYEHDRESSLTENGHLIWVNYCRKELEEAWNRRSTIKFNEKDLNGNLLEFTLVRFLASKGLKKDGDAVISLTKDEIMVIERGVTNVNYQNVSSLRGRIYETLWEIEVYKTTGNANGHSLTQRFEYWRAAWGIIKANPLIGIGTGDVPKAFEGEYIKNNSSLSQQWRLRAHNQYLSIAVAFGIIGLLLFLTSLIYPLLDKNNRYNFLYFTFFIIAVVSFFTEDTLETQAGVTFYAFLNTFLLFAEEKKKLSEGEGRG